MKAKDDFNLKSLSKWIDESVNELAKGVITEFYKPLLKDNKMFATVCVSCPDYPAEDYDVKNGRALAHDEGSGKYYYIEVSIRKHDEYDMMSYANDWEPFFVHTCDYIVSKEDFDNGCVDAAKQVLEWREEILRVSPPLETLCSIPDGYKNYWSYQDCLIYDGKLIGWDMTRDSRGAQHYYATEIPPIDEDDEPLYNEIYIDITRYEYLRLSVGDREIAKSVCKQLAKSRKAA